MNDLSRVVGENQRRLRAEQGLSLDALAKSSGVSKSRLGQIERGEANPSISTVWQIATALKVEFSALISAPRQESVTASKRDVEPIIADDRRCRTYLLFPYDPAYGFEFYTSEIDGGGCLTAEPHPPGTHETLMVEAGRLTLEVAGVKHVLAPGDAMRFRADQTHSYANEGESVVEFTMVVAYPR